MVFELSRHITDETALRKLATSGLEVRENVIATHLNDHRHSITEAAHQVITHWRKSVEDSSEAYSKLCDALRKTGMAFLIAQALK